MTTAAPPPASELAYLVARARIQDLLARCFVSLDRGDFATLRSCFVPEATFTQAGVAGPPGRDDIVERLRAAANVQDPPNGRRSYHFLVDQTLQVQGESATSEAYASAHLVLSRDEGLLLRTQGLRIRDDLVLRRGRWYIRHREQIIDWERDDPVTLPVRTRRRASP